jgi:hypothetical protein
MARKPVDRLSALLRLGATPEVNELASVLGTLARSRRRLAAFLAKHPAGCRCALCGAVPRQPAGEGLRDYLTAVVAALTVYPSLADGERPRTRREWARICGEGR